MSAMYADELGLGPNALDRPLRNITSLPRELPITSVEQSRLAEEREGANTQQRVGQMLQGLEPSARRRGQAATEARNLSPATYATGI